MTKDYAKRKRSTRKTNTRVPRKKSSPKKNISPLLVFLSGILVTLFVVFLWAIIKKPDVIQDLTSDDPAQTTQPAETSTKAAPKKTPTEKQQPEFTYHDTLTNKEVDVEITKPKASAINKIYIMQCGAFKNKDDAEKMKAELAFVGFQANILTKGSWHRVRLGPYDSKRKAESDRHNLQDNNFLNCQIW